MSREGEFETTWEAVHRLATEGYSKSEIARQLDITTPCVYIHLGRPRPSRRVRRRSDAGSTAARCLSCNAPIAMYGVKGQRVVRCRECYRARQKGLAAFELSKRCRQLVVAAEATGFVPTVREAQTILGLGRSVAAAVLLEAFGPDDRLGSDRRRGRRKFDRRRSA